MKKRYISAEDIERLFYREAKKRRLPSWQLISACLLIVIGIFFLINGPAITQQLRYWWETDIQAAEQARPAALQSTVNQIPVNPITPAPNTTPNASIPKPAVTSDPTNLAEGTLWIPRIKVKAPVIWDVTNGHDVNTDMIEALRSGVARYPQTALPDQIGNVFLTGHSSNYWWEKGSYKTVFALLDRLVVGDTIYIKYHGRLYTYKVSGQKVVKPEETSVLNPTTTPTLSLMTCTPTGTSLLRRIVTANLVSPTDGLTPQKTSPKSADLQAIR